MTDERVTEINEAVGEDIGADLDGIGAPSAAGLAPATPAPADTDPSAAGAPEKPPEGFEGDWNDPKDRARFSALTDERTKRRDAVDQATKAAAEAAYWRGLAEGRQQPGGNGSTPQLTEEEALRREEEYLADPLGQTKQIVRSTIKEALGEFTMAQSVARMQAEKPDYLEKIAVYQQMSAKDGTLDVHLGRQSDPARWAYDYVVRQEALAKQDDPEALEAKVKERVDAEVAKIRREMGLSDAATTPPTPARGSASGGTAPANSGANIPDPLDGNAFD